MHMALNLCKFMQDVYGVGSPMPSMHWTKNGEGVGDSVVTDQTPEFCRIKLKSPVRGDKGSYELELVNSVGKDKVPITINVLGKDLVIVSASFVLLALWFLAVWGSQYLVCSAFSTIYLMTTES